MYAYRSSTRKYKQAQSPAHQNPKEKPCSTLNRNELEGSGIGESGTVVDERTIRLDCDVILVRGSLDGVNASSGARLLTDDELFPSGRGGTRGRDDVVSRRVGGDELARRGVFDRTRVGSERKVEGRRARLSRGARDEVGVGRGGDDVFTRRGILDDVVSSRVRAGRGTDGLTGGVRACGEEVELVRVGVATSPAGQGRR